MIYTPIVIEQTGNGERSYDIYSRLLKDRIILLAGEITDSLANSIVAQLLFLAADDENEDICLYINSPGGSISAGFAIFDTMNYIKPDVKTICIGMSASMAAFLLASGAKGKRFALENSEIMIHQPLGGASGQATDISIAANRIIKTKEKINTILGKLTGKTKEDIEKDSERDYYMDSQEALQYGLIDEIIQKKTK